MKKRVIYLVGCALIAAGLAACFVGCRGIRPPAGVQPTRDTVVATGYCKCGKCCGWRRTWYGTLVVSSGPNKGKRKQVGITASGTKARLGTVAADTDIYPFGTVMKIPGYGYARVEDRGSAIKGRRVDLYFTSHSKAERWGRQELEIEVWLPPDAPAE